MQIKQKHLKEIFEFLKTNHKWNKDFQSSEHEKMLNSGSTPNSRLLSLLQTIANTQSQPKLSTLASFWRLMHKYDGKSLDAFTKHLQDNTPSLRERKQKTYGRWDALFTALKAQPGWGEKTAALFVKTVIQVHRGPEKLHFWPDVEQQACVPASDKIFLPVDEVIKQIFKVLDFDKAINFNNINKALQDRYSPEDLLIWDDLWYWGFFTQVVRNKKRYLEWNTDKFWCMPSAPKSQEPEVTALGNQFIQILKKEH